LTVEDFFRARSRSAVLLLCGGVLLASFGCHRSPSPDVVATVNGKDITRVELEKYYKNSLGDAPQAPSEEQANVVRLNVLRSMIENEILQQRATKLHLVASDEDVNAKLTEMKALMTQEEIDRQLKARGITLDDLKLDVRQQLTKTKLLNKEIESKINITDSDINAFYNAHKAEFNFIEPQYHLAWIVVTGAPSQQSGNLQNNKASGDADAKKKIQELHNRLSNGEDFGAVATNFSEDSTSSPNGGDRGFVPESQLRSDPEAYALLSKLKPGEITNVLPVFDSNAPGRRPVGYAIYKLISHDPAGQRELNDPRVQQAIRSALRENRFQLLKTAYFDMLHNDAKVHNYFADQVLKQGAK